MLCSNTGLFEIGEEQMCRFIQTEGNSPAVGLQVKATRLLKAGLSPKHCKNYITAYHLVPPKGQITCAHITHRSLMEDGHFANGLEQAILSQDWAVPSGLLQSRSTWLQTCCFPYVNAYNTFHLGKCNGTKAAGNFLKPKNVWELERINL